MDAGGVAAVAAVLLMADQMEKRFQQGQQLQRELQAEVRATRQEVSVLRGELCEARRALADTAAAARGEVPPAWRDWGNALGKGLPEEVLAKIAEMLVAQNEAAYEAQLRQRGHSEGYIQKRMAERKRDGNCLFVFAMVCKPWRKAQLKVGGPLRTRVKSDVILPGSVALAKWALAEGCHRDDEYETMAHHAAEYRHTELVEWLCGEGGGAMDEELMWKAASTGNLELVRWLRGEGCPWDLGTCLYAVDYGHEEVLRWARENGCEWDAATRDRAGEELGYWDDLGNLA